MEVRPLRADDVLLGLEGPCVVVSPRVAYRLAPILASQLRAAVQRGEHLDEELVVTVGALEVSANRYAASRVAAGASSVIGTPGIPMATTTATIGQMSTTEVASRLGCGQRNVVALARRGTLAGRQVAGRWLFDTDDVDDFEATRETSA